MAQTLSPYNAWILNIQNAHRDGQPLPLPEGVQLSTEDYQSWQLATRQSIDAVRPVPDPREWAHSQQSGGHLQSLRNRQNELQKQIAQQRLNARKQKA